MMPEWHQLVLMSGHLEGSKTAKNCNSTRLQSSRFIRLFVNSTICSYLQSNYSMRNPKSHKHVTLYFSSSEISDITMSEPWPKIRVVIFPCQTLNDYSSILAFYQHSTGHHNNVVKTFQEPVFCIFSLFSSKLVHGHAIYNLGKILFICT